MRKPLLLLFLLAPSLVLAQMGNFRTQAISGAGRPIPGVNVSVCQGMATTAASVTSGVATLTMASNPITAGFTLQSTIIVAGFTNAADAYFEGSYTITSLSTTQIQYALSHVNAVASSNGNVVQEGNSTTACLPLATLYTDVTGTVTSPNPVVSDGLGNVTYWALPEVYQQQYYGSQITTTVQSVSVPITGGSSFTAVNFTVTGNLTATAGQNQFAGYNLENAQVLDGCIPSVLIPKYACTRAGLQTALTAAGVRNGVFIPPGVNLIWDATPLVINQAAQFITCGMASVGKDASVFWVTQNTADLFQINNEMFSMNDCTIDVTSITGSRTGFAIFNMNNVNATLPKLENVRLNGSTTFSGGDIFSVYGTGLNFSPLLNVEAYVSGYWDTAVKIGSSAGTISGHNIWLYTYPQANFAVAEVLLDSGADTFNMLPGSVLWNGGAGGAAPVIWTRNTIGTQMPRFISFGQTAFQCHNNPATIYCPGIQLDAVQDFTFTNSPFVGGVQNIAILGANASGVNISYNYAENIQGSAFTVAAGGHSNTFSTNILNDVGCATNNTYPIFLLANGVSDLTITATQNKHFFCANLPSYGVSAAGTLTRVVVDTNNNWGLQGTDYAAATPFSGAVPYQNVTLLKGSGGGNYTSASTTYVVVDSTNLCRTVTIPVGWKLGISASGSLGTSTAIVNAFAAVTDNAACGTANAGIIAEAQADAGTIGGAVGFMMNPIITGDGAAHNIALQFRTANAADSALLLNSSATLTPMMGFTLMPSN